MNPSAPSRLMRRRLIIAGVILLGVAISIFGHVRARHREDARIMADFARRAQIRNALTESVINNFEARLFGLRHLYISSDDVTREEFARSAREILERYGGITALQWVPIVPAAARAGLEAAATAELGRPFEFTARNAAGQLVRSPAADEHLPILYVEPFAGNEPTLGFDLTFGPTTETLARARRSGRMATSPLFRLVQEPADARNGVVFIWPVYGHTPGGDRELLGFVQGVFRVREMLEESFKLQPGQALDALYLDPKETDPALRVIHYRAGQPLQSAHRPDEAEFRRGPHWEEKLAVGDREWIALYRPERAWLQTQQSTYPVWRLLGGFVMTGLLAGLIHAIGRRTEGIELEVAERTAELSESRRQLESMLQSLPGMAYRCTYGPEGMRPFYFSAGALGLTGCTAEDLVAGRPHLRELIHPADLPVVRERTRQALDEKLPFELEYRLRLRDGSEKWVLSRGQGVQNASGRQFFFEGLVIDITARKQAETDRLAMERRLLESQKLESLGLLAGGVAHDFNNLLTSIVGNAGLVRLDLPAGSTADTCLRQIETAAHHAAELCQQMLTFSGKGRLSMEPLSLGNLIETLIPLVQPSLNPRIRLHLRLAAELPPIRADASQLRQVVMNLVINASDAIGDREGEIVVTTAPVRLTRRLLAECSIGSEMAEGPGVVLEVRDTGQGMNREVLARIFDPFFTTKLAGRGLGLAAIPGIVKAHGGALQVSSTPGQGTAFRFYLAPVATPKPATVTANGKVLIIDDDHAICELTAELLGTLGYRAVIAHGGQAGIDRLRESPEAFTAVLLDAVMPGLTGAEACTRLQALRSDLPVIFMSGQEPDTATPGAIWLKKPFTREELLQALRSATGK
jgi:PAS domain S-box-containing protein